MENFYIIYTSRPKRHIVKGVFVPQFTQGSKHGFYFEDAFSNGNFCNIKLFYVP